MLWSSSTLLAAGFNCTKASTAIEKAICANRSLSQMDSSLGKLYSQRLKGLPKAETNQLKQEQREWLAQRNNCSTVDVDCLLSSYRQRIAELTTEGQDSPSVKQVESLTSSPPTPLSVARTVSLTSRPVAANAWCGIVNTEKSSLDVYAGMSQDTKVVATASKGSALTCTETTQTDWYKVTLDDGQTGYTYAPGEFILGPGLGRDARCGTVETEDATLNVREGMGTNTKVIDKVRKNARIRILDNRGEEGEWLKVQIDNGKLGYVRKKFVDISETVSLTSMPVAANAWCGIVNTEKSSLDVYADMSQNTKVVATASKGSALTCTETTQTDWYKVTLDDGQAGYAYAPGEFILGPGPGRGARCGTVETEDATLNVREGMGTNTKVIDKVRKNAMIRILDNRGEEGEWLKVQIDNGKLGYVRKKFVDISETVSETVKPTSDKPKPVTETTSPPTELQAVESTPKSEKLKPVTETISPPKELQAVESTPKSEKPKPVTETISPPKELQAVESTPKSEKPKPVTETISPPKELQAVESTQELDKIDKPIVAMEVKPLSPEEIQAIQDALKTLQKLSASTEVGVNFKEYGTLVIEAKAQTNAALVKLSEGGLKEELEATMNAYMDALRAWDAIIKHKFDSEYDDPELTETLFAKYPILTTIDNDEIEKMVTPVIWHFAGEHLKRTNELFNRSLQKTQSSAEQFKIIVGLLIVIVFLGLYVIWGKLLKNINLKNIKLTSFKAKPVGETSQQMIAVNQEGYSSSPIEVIETTIKLQQKQEYLPSIQGVSALQKSGGIIALIAGIFGIIAALVTLDSLVLLKRKVQEWS